MTDWREDLFKEKSLWDIYRLSRTLPQSRFNVVLRRGTFFILFSFCILNEYLGNRLLSIGSMEAAVRNWSEQGLAFAAQTLGFLIAGYTIFATITRPELNSILAQTPEKRSKINSLKFIHTVFISVFISYLSFVSFCLAITLFANSSGPLTALLHPAVINHRLMKAFVVSGIFCIEGTWLVELLLLLKSFVWNLYQAVLVVIAWEAPPTVEKENPFSHNGDF